MYRHYRTQYYEVVQQQDYRENFVNRQNLQNQQNDVAGAVIMGLLMAAAVVTAVVLFVSQSTHNSYEQAQEYKKPEKKRSKKHMPNIFKWAIYAAIVKLVWMAVNNAPMIAQFITSQFIK